MYITYSICHLEQKCLGVRTSIFKDNQRGEVFGVPQTCDMDLAKQCVIDIDWSMRIVISASCRRNHAETMPASRHDINIYCP